MPYPAVPCFLIEPSGTFVRTATVWCGGDEDHRSEVVREEHLEDVKALDWDEVEWPETCPVCLKAMDYEEESSRSTSTGRRWVRKDTGEEHDNLREFGPGAMWDADWMPDSMKGPDGRCLCVILPNGREWNIDSRAANCTRRDDDVHQCWVRHGEPPNLTVDKNGDTCAAGAGSIMAGDYHGFLQAGVLTAG